MLPPPPPPTRKSDGLLGLNYNSGQKICVRLRPPNAPDSFYPYEHVLGTLLHELVHIVHGPHRYKPTFTHTEVLVMHHSKHVCLRGNLHTLYTLYTLNTFLRPPRTAPRSTRCSTF